MAASDTLREAIAVFHDADALEAAVSELQSHGFNRADISFLANEAPEQERRIADSPDAPRSAPVSDSDVRQGRALAASMAATIAGFAAAGFTVATGGTFLLALGAGAVAAGGIGAASAFIGKKAADQTTSFLDAEFARGGVLLWVRTRDPQWERRALEVLRRHSGQDVHLHDLPATT
jgi:hypothetical protein